MLNRILFAGGGTGGHVFMAVALRDALNQGESPPREFLFVGTPSGMENQILPPRDFPLATIQVGALKNVGFRRRLTTMVELPRSLWQSSRIIRKFAPDIIVGLGGYSSGPVLLAGRLMRRKCILIEPNVRPGFTNRMLRPIVNAAAVAFEETARYFPGKAELTGIPIREAFFGIQPKVRFSPPLHVLVFGGSRGSHPINQLVCQSLEYLEPGQFKIRHQTGRDDQPEVEKIYSRFTVPAEIRAFIEDMPSHFAWADVVIGRAGASTVAEITAAGLPSILIPFPQAADDHQRKNAEVLEKHGASFGLDQHRVTGEHLARILNRLGRQPEQLVSMASASKALSQPDSASRILGLMRKVIQEQ